MFDLEKAKELAKQGYGKQQIASKLGCSYSYLTSKLPSLGVRPFMLSCSLLHTRFGARVAEILVDRGYTVKTLSVKSGLHHTVISRILTGRQDIRLSEMDRIAKALDVDLKSLF